MKKNSPPLHDILAEHDSEFERGAKKRVWAKLQDSLSLSMPQAQGNTRKNPSWKSAPVVAGLTVTVALAGALSWYLISQNQRNIVATPRTIDVSGFKTVAEKAAARLSYLTNGASQDALTLAAKNSTNSPASTSANESRFATGGASVTAMAKPAISLPAPAKNEAQEAERDKIVYSNEYEVTIGDLNALPAEQRMYTLAGPYGLGSNTTYTEKSMSSSNYYKTVIEKDGKIVNAYVGTPAHYIEYLGGKYAIKTIYPENNYFTSFLSSTNSNPEAEFLKLIISGESGYKQIGTETVNGITYDSFELKYEALGGQISGDMATSVPVFPTNSRSVYLVNQKTFEVYQQSEYLGDVLTTTRTLKKAEQIDKPDLGSLFSLSGVELREYKQADFTLKKQDFETISDRYGFLVDTLDSLSNPTALYASNYEEQARFESLRYSKDYDPNFGTENSIYGLFTQMNSSTLFSYSASSLNATISKEKPQSISEVSMKAAASFAPSETSLPAGQVTPVATTVSIDGVTLTGEYDGYSYQFQHKGVWWQVTKYSSDLGNSNVQPLVLLTAPKSEVLKAADEAIRYSNARPMLRFVEPKDIPGDALSFGVIPGVNLTNVSVVDKQDRTCLDIGIINSTYDLSQCLITAFGGVNYSYNQLSTLFAPDTTTSSVEYKYLDAAIVNTRVSDIPFTNLKEFAYTDKGVSNKATPLKYDASGTIRKVIFGDVVNGVPSTVWLLEKNGKTVVVNATGYTENEIQTLVDGISVRKDNSELQKQWMSPPVNPAAL